MFKYAIIFSITLAAQIGCAMELERYDLSPRGNKTLNTLKIDSTHYKNLNEQDKTTLARIGNNIENQGSQRKPGSTIRIKDRRSLEYKVNDLSAETRNECQTVDECRIVGEYDKQYGPKDLVADI